MRMKKGATRTLARWCQMTDDELARHVEQEVLGEWVRALPCGCVMELRQFNSGTFYGHVLHLCGEHKNGNPYVNARVPRD